MTILIILIAIVIVGYFLFKGGEKQFDRTRPILSYKYKALAELMLQGHPDTRIWTDINNKLIIGVRSNLAGNTLFHLNETTENNVFIKYELSNNPVYKDFILRFEFPSQMCINYPEKVFAQIGSRIEKASTDGSLTIRQS